MTDRHDTAAEAVLPCRQACHICVEAGLVSEHNGSGHQVDCPASYRPAVAALLRKGAEQNVREFLSMIDAHVVRYKPERQENFSNTVLADLASRVRARWPFLRLGAKKGSQ